MKLNKIKITSKSIIKENQKFSLNLFKKPFCAKEKKEYKHKEIINYKNKKFWNSSKEFNKFGKVLFVSGPGRQGNHLAISLLDNNPEIFPNIGEDKFIENFFNNYKVENKKTIKKATSKNSYKFLLNLSGLNNFNKWKALWLAEKRKYIPKTHSGNEKNKKWYTDYKGFVPKINYPKFSSVLKNLQNQINKNSTFLEIFKNYLIATNSLLDIKKNKFKINYRFAGSSLRRELFYLFEKTNNVYCVAPIRKFESFYFSFAKSYYGETEIREDLLNEAWEHWRHKVIDYLLLKKQYPNKIIIVRFEDLIGSPLITYKKLCIKLKVNQSVKGLKTKILGKEVKGNSSTIEKNKRNKFGIYTPAGNKFDFDKSIMPREYKDIVKLIDKYSI